MPFLAVLLFISSSFFGETAGMRLVHDLPSESQLRCAADLTYSDSGGKELKFDLYRPVAAPHAGGYPVMVFLNGIGADWIRSHPQYSGWSRLVTSAGFAGVALDTQESHIAENFDALVAYLRSHAREFNLNPDHLVVFACSANVTAGLPLIMDESRTYIHGAVIYYGNAQVPSFRRDLPLLIVRAGLDAPMINRGIENLISAANAANAPVTVINYASGHHGFDLYDDNALTRSIMDATLEFVKATTRPDLQQQRTDAILDAGAAAALFTKNWNEAIRCYQKLLEQRPTSADLEGKLGEAYFGAKLYETAIVHYDKALKLGSKNAGMLSYAAAIASLRLGDKQQALSWLTKVAEIPPMRSYALSDPELAPLRDDPKFGALFPKP